MNIYFKPKTNQIINIRYRCFDMPSLSCKFNYMVPVGVCVGYVALYLLFKTMFAGLSYYHKEECIDITETLEEVSVNALDHFNRIKTLSTYTTPAPLSSESSRGDCRERKSGPDPGFLGIPRQASSRRLEWS